MAENQLSEGKSRALRARERGNFAPSALWLPFFFGACGALVWIFDACGVLQLLVSVQAPSVSSPPLSRSLGRGSLFASVIYGFPLDTIPYEQGGGLGMDVSVDASVGKRVAAQS